MVCERMSFFPDCEPVAEDDEVLIVSSDQCGDIYGLDTTTINFMYEDNPYVTLNWLGACLIEFDEGKRPSQCEYDYPINTDIIEVITRVEDDQYAECFRGEIFFPPRPQEGDPTTDDDIC